MSVIIESPTTATTRSTTAPRSRWAGGSWAAARFGVRATPMRAIKKKEIGVRRMGSRGVAAVTWKGRKGNFF